MRVAETANDHARQAGGPSALSYTMATKAFALCPTNPSDAIEILDAATELDQTCESDWFSAYGLSILNSSLYQSGRYSAVLRHSIEFLQRQLRMGFGVGTHQTVESLALWRETWDPLIWRVRVSRASKRCLGCPRYAKHSLSSRSKT